VTRVTYRCCVAGCISKGVDKRTVIQLEFDQIHSDKRYYSTIREGGAESLQGLMQTAGLPKYPDQICGIRLFCVLTDFFIITSFTYNCIKFLDKAINKRKFHDMLLKSY
jgi:hypothetical protein